MRSGNRVTEPSYDRVGARDGANGQRTDKR
jgi:hypothetical protein